MEEETVELDLSEFKKDSPPKINRRKSYFHRIEEYTLDGIYIRTWDGAGSAADYHKVTLPTISECCRGVSLQVNKIKRIFIQEGASIDKRLKEIENQLLLRPQKFAFDEYDINGNFVRAWQSLTEAHASKNPVIPSTIKKVCQGKMLFSKKDKRIFLYHGASIKDRLELIRQAKYNAAMKNSINEYSMSGDIVKRWKSAADITLEYNIPSIKVLDCCFGNSNSVNRKIFLFSDGDIKERIKRIKSKKKIKND